MLFIIWGMTWKEYITTRMFFHCEPIEKVADEFIERSDIVNGIMTMFPNAFIQFRVIGL